jgi:2-(1,2-epoxy-1,2-dihydrophenyl)acetyl-CoA isomerase
VSAAPTEADVLRSDPAPGVAQLAFNRPALKNALRRRTWRDLLDALAQCAEERDTRVVVIAGTGGAFCSGADLRDSSALADGPVAGMRLSNAASRALHEFPKPTIAMVDGVAAGGGVSLALGCDFVFATPSTVFKVLFTRRALTLDCGASWLLPRLIGLRRATELALLGGDIGAAEAAADGLINGVIDADVLAQHTLQVARQLASLPGEALASTKALLHRSVAHSMADALEDELHVQSLAFSSPDFREAVRAFAERRPPRWSR